MLLVFDSSLHDYDCVTQRGQTWVLGGRYTKSRRVFVDRQNTPVMPHSALTTESEWLKDTAPAVRCQQQITRSSIVNFTGTQHH